VLFSVVLFCFSSCSESPETRFNELVSQGDSGFANREYKSALAFWSGALRIQPVSVVVLKKIAQTYLRLGESSRAEKIFKQILQIRSDADDILLELTKLQLVTGMSVML